MSLSDSLAHLKKEYSEFQVEVLLLHLLERLVVVPHGATRGAKGAATMDGMGADGMGGGWEGEGGRMWERSWQGEGRAGPAREKEVVDPGAVGGTIHLSAPPEQRSTY